MAEHAVAEHLFALAAEDGEVRGVDVHHAELGIAQHHPVLSGVEDGAVLLFARAQRFLGALARADVARHVQHVRPALVLDRDAAQLDVDLGAVLAQRTVSTTAGSPASARRWRAWIVASGSTAPPST